MPFDSNGTASLVPSYFVRDGDTILPSQHNPVLEDIRSMLSNVVVRDGRAPLTGPLNANGNKITGVVDGTDPTDVASVGQAAAVIGDFKDTVRTLDGKWLRRNGALYNSVDYPTLASMLPALPDGVIWENVASGSATTGDGITQGPDRLTAISKSGSNSVITASINGAAWDVRATLNSFSSQAIQFGGGIYAAVDGNGKYSYSNDGDIWSSPSTLSGTSPGITSITFGNALFVMTGTLNSAKAIWTSPDAVTWTSRATGTLGAGVMWGVSYANNVFIATGSNGSIHTSTDGITWTLRTSGVTASLNASTYISGVYVVVGDTGTILTSTNLTGWTSRTSGTTNALNSVASSSAGILAVGAGGVARISNLTASTWSPTTTGVTANLRVVIVDSANPAKYYVAGPQNSHLYGTRTQPTQFRTPNDNPTYGWIRAL